MNKLKWLLFLVVLAGTQPTLASSLQEPLDLIQKTSNQVLAKISSKKEELNESPEKIYDLVNEIVIPHFDFSSMSRMVLGKHWRKANDTQKSEFIEQFRMLLVRTYAIALLNYSDQAIEYLPMHKKAGASKALVKTEVRSSGAPAIPINYRLHQKEGSWKVYDVIIDNVSLVSNYRTGFSSQIRRKGLDGLIARLKKKNNKVSQ